MTVYIVAARISENGTITGNQGDQTGREVCKQTLSSSGTWTRVLRPPRNAQIIVKQALAAAANDNIGYDQYQRTTLYTAARAVNFDLSRVGKCECDCSSLVAVLCIAAGFDVSPDIYTGNECAALVAAGFANLSFSSEKSKVIPGDVLWRKGHTAVVVDNDGGSVAPAQAPTPSGSLAVDGEWGKATTRALQRYLGTPVDGIVSGQRTVYRKHWPSCLASSWQWGRSGSSQMIAALQRLIGCGADGIAGPATCKALQRRLGVAVDGIAGPKTVKALQKALNNGRI